MPFEHWLYGWRIRLRMLFDRGRADRELTDELRHHVALETEVRRAKGVPPAEAHRQALATLGGLESTVLGLSAVGLALGLVGGAAVGQGARNLLFGVGAMDPLTFAGGSALLL